MKKNYDCWFDGATNETNPSTLLGIGAYIEEDGVGVFEGSFGFPISNGMGSNNYSEYLALITILQFFSGKDLTDCTINIHGDSKMVINQMNGTWKIKDGLYKYRALEAQAILGELKESANVNLKWIPREKNTRADQLSKDGLLT